MYRCPKCKEALLQKDREYVCPENHHYDIAKQGYVHLLLGNKKGTGDNQEMVQARTQFLNHGYYNILRQRVCELVYELNPHTLIDAGCGEGYYTNEIKAKLTDCNLYGFDLSKFALKEAAKAKMGVHYAVASVADLPMMDACADAVLTIFAPIYSEEIKRLLKENGCFIKVGPGPKHLWELKQVLYETVYENTRDQPLKDFTLIHEECLETQIQVIGKEDITALFSMTPYYYRSPKETSELLKNMETLTTRLQFQIEIWQKQCNSTFKAMLDML